MITDPKLLYEKSYEIRRHNMKTIVKAKLGHTGGDLSVTDILTTLYFGVLNVDPSKPTDPERDRLILSKGHCSGAFYTVLAYRGFFPVEMLDTYEQALSPLNGHPSNTKLPGIETSTGPLGHGLPFGVGTAIAAKMDKSPRRVFVITGDGELQEGSNWEAAMAAAHHKLDNLTVIIDRNGLQQGDYTESTNGLEPLADKWRAFGWEVVEVDGHDHAALLDLFQRVPLQAGKPTCVLAHTHKGQGVSFVKDQVGWHHRVMTQEELEKALAELGEVKA